MPLVAQVPARRPARSAARAPGTFSRSHSIARLGFPNGLSLDGTTAERTISFRLPANAPLDSARLSIYARFSPQALPQSNLQVFVNGVRRGVILRESADTSGRVATDIELPGTGLGTDYATVRLRSSVAVSSDRCFDEHVAATFVEIDSATSFTYFAAAGAIRDIRQVWAALPDTTVISLPARELTTDEFRAAMAVAGGAMSDGHAVAYAKLPALGDVTIARASDIVSLPGVVQAPVAGANVSVLRDTATGTLHYGILLDPARGGLGSSLLTGAWAPLATSPAADVRAAASPDSLANEITFQQLGISDLARDAGAEATWSIPIDVRDLPPGRVPSRIKLSVVTSPNTNGRQLVVFVFWNGTLVSSADVVANGGPQALDVRLPAALVTMRNELRVTLLRHVPPVEQCVQSDASMPAQLLPTSRVVTSAADQKARTFSAVAANLSSASSLYLPRAALSAPADYLTIVAQIGRAFWSARRAPTPVFFDRAAPAAPAGAFVVIGRPDGVTLAGPVAADTGRLTIRRRDGGATLLDVADLRAWSVAQVVQWNSQSGVQLVVPAGPRLVADWAGAYGTNTLTLANADSTLFNLNTAGDEGSLLFNDGPTLVERLRSDWILWVVFGILVIAPLIYFSIRAVVKRTPRRQLPPRGDRPSGRLSTDTRS
ncbi:MAG: cellulose biosynthesis cyclic di-GMP-binding regulatory protein BcsB [Gemmatimonadaceae bacterium]